MTHTPTPWHSDDTAIFTGDGVLARIPNHPDNGKNWEADANFIVTAVNNHAPMVKSLEHCAKLFDTLAQTLDRWAIESQTGGWSTHQVQENINRANDCRRYAAMIRSALPIG